MKRLRTGLALGLFGVASCGGEGAQESETQATDSGAWFEDVAPASGIDFVHRSGHDQAFYTPEVVCGGVALLDADDNGLLDVYFVQSGALEAAPEDRPGNRLYRNLGGFRFTDSTSGAAADRGYGIGAATGDYDNDGDVDLYVTNVGANTLLRNDGHGSFENATAVAGVGDEGFGSSAAFVDLDADGWLDLFVLNYLVWSIESEKECFNSLGARDYCAPATYNAPAADVLYANAGDGTFRDITQEAGLRSGFGTGLGVACGDFTGDGLVDLFVANDGRLDQLWVNQGGLRFVDEGLLRGCAMDQDGKPKAGMGVATGDVDGDGDLDLLISNLRRESDSVFRNEGTHFRDATAVSGLGTTSRAFTRFGTGWVDFDADGQLDLYQANGRVVTDVDGHSTTDPLAEPNLLFRGLAGGRFEEVLPRGGTAELQIHTSRAAAFGDLDNDGALDLVVANRDAAPYVLRNRAPQAGHWLLVRVLNTEGRDALGAMLILQAGGRLFRRDVRTAYSYCAANDPRVHFGLGSQDRIEAFSVVWPDGEHTRLPIPELDRRLEVRRMPAPKAPQLRELP